MTDITFHMQYAGHEIRYQFLKERTPFFFKKYIRHISHDSFDIKMTKEYFDLAREENPEDASDSYVEYRGLIALTGKELLRYNCCIFHSISFLFKGKAWLIAAPSGVGKTTQYLNWQKAWPDEIRMICGDMPVLKMDEKGEISVHPTVWNGKEDIGSRDLSAPLGGIVFLEQGNHNSIRRANPHELVMAMFEQFMARPDNEEQIMNLASIIRTLMEKYPIWKLVNLGDIASTSMIRRTLNDALKGDSHG